MDHAEFSGDIVDEMKKMIKGSIAVIADISEGRANVLYEAGYAHALDKPTVHISWAPVDALPFDVRQWKTIQYNRGQIHQLRPALAKRLQALLR